MDTAESLPLLEEQVAAIESLESLIREIKNGDVMEFIGSKIRTDGTYDLVGGSTANCHQMAGMLLELAMSRLRQSHDVHDDEDDDT